MEQHRRGTTVTAVIALLAAVSALLFGLAAANVVHPTDIAEGVTHAVRLASTVTDAR
jgi:hypothetical protein